MESEGGAEDRGAWGGTPAPPEAPSSTPCSEGAPLDARATSTSEEGRWFPVRPGPERLPTGAQLRAMLAILDTGSFGGAATALGVTQSSVSQAVRQLERTVGASLFRRGPRGTEPTELCRRVERDARQTLLLLEGFASATRPAAELAGTIRIVSYRSVATHVLPGVLSSLQARHPNLRIAVDGSCTEIRDPELRVLDGHAHIGLGQLPMGPDLFTAQITADAWVVVLPAPTAGGATDPWERLKRMGRIRYTRSAVPPALDRLLESHGLDPRPFMVMSEDSSILAAVARGVGYVVMPRLAVEPVPAGVEVVPFEEPLVRRLGFGVEPRLMATPPVRAVVRALLDVADVGGGG